MSMIKKGVIDENTPPVQGDGQPGHGAEPGTKEAADQLQSHPVNDMIDAVAAQTQKNK